MAQEKPLVIRPDDPADIGKRPQFDGTSIVWTPVTSTETGVRRKALTFEGYASSPDPLEWDCWAGSGGAVTVGPPSNNWSGAPWTSRSKVLKLTTPVANGSTTHTGQQWSAGATLNGYTYTDPDGTGGGFGSPLLADLAIQPGDRITCSFKVMADTLTAYAGADAGRYIYPGVEYDQRADWTNLTMRAWVGDYAPDGSGTWVPSMQDLQYSEWFSGSMWRRFPTVWSYESEATPGLTGICPTIYFYKLWKENRVQIEVAELEIQVVTL